MPYQTELWRADAPRILSDSELARVLGITPGYVPKLRAKGWLPRRGKVEYTGQAGGKGVPRYRFIDLVAAECARISKAEFGWPESDLRRMVEIIRSGDEAAVRGSGLVQVRTDAILGTVGKVKVIFVSPEEMAGDLGAEIRADLARPHNTPWRKRRVLDVTPLIDVVEAVANMLYGKLARAGVEFSGVAASPKPRKRKH